MLLHCEMCLRSELSQMPIIQKLGNNWQQLSWSWRAAACITWYTIANIVHLLPDWQLALPFSAAWCEPSPTCMPTHTLPTTLPYSLKRPRCPSFLLVQVITIIVIFFSSVGGLMVNCQTAGIFCFSTTESINLYHRSSIVKWKTI